MLENKTNPIVNLWNKAKPYLSWFFFSFIWIAIVLFVVDIVTKTIIKDNMQVGDQIVLIPEFLAIGYVQNNGMAFGMNLGNDLANMIFFISVSVIGAAILIFIIAKYWKKIKGVPRAALMLMISGTIGNLIDRAFYVTPNGKQHYVVDWIAFFYDKNIPVFNIADACLTIGALIIIVYLLVTEIIQENKKKKILVKEKASGEIENDLKDIDPEDRKTDDE
jgi:signal peptidase II